MSEEFKPFTIKVETPEEANFLRAILGGTSWDDWNHFADYLENVRHDTEEEAARVIRIGLQYGGGHGIPGFTIYSRLPQSLKDEYYPIYVKAPRKIGCRDITYSKEGVDFINPDGNKYSLSAKQLRAMADKCDGGVV